jgi:isopentenyl diphosphate isomerase/L-lactate dehydrogenase-like FMN-dependent dehydrogenase
MELLAEIVAVANARATILVDGGFCRGTDIVKALAAGADGVGLGRMQCFGLAADGQNGIVRMLELLEDEVKRCLALLGVTGFAGLDRSYLHPAPPTTVPHVLSAFPLLDIEDYRY